MPLSCKVAYATTRHREGLRSPRAAAAKLAASMFDITNV